METATTIRKTKHGVEILKNCYFCKELQWCEVIDSYKYKCTVCHRPPNNGHYYHDRFGKE